ncbi:hypothetical protein KPL37_00155 [Clostridium frigoris]|uniref:DNA-binding response regulator n=1 Tax=Clostridium frigoris TaxID=205327 RepID=A0ABS6BQ85_9CLOT|nr:hypothetical protein [Clostridium frigoris]MBU3158184.1 hypothetical protein [Clostridium frigoris]
MNKILIIEDDLKLKKYIQEYLNAYDYFQLHLKILISLVVKENNEGFIIDTM